MVLGFRVSYHDGSSTSSTVSRAPMCPCSACWEGLPHGTKAMNSWRKKKQQSESPSSSTTSLASTASEKSVSPSSSLKSKSKSKKTLASRLTRRPSTESFASDLVPLRGAVSIQSDAAN